MDASINRYSWAPAVIYRICPFPFLSVLSMFCRFARTLQPFHRISQGVGRSGRILSQQVRWTTTSSKGVLFNERRVIPRVFIHWSVFPAYWADLLHFLSWQVLEWWQRQHRVIQVKRRGWLVEGSPSGADCADPACHDTMEMFKKTTEAVQSRIVDGDK